MTNFTTLSVYDNRQLSTSGKGKAKRYFCDKIEIGKETFLLIVANRTTGHVMQKEFVPKRHTASGTGAKQEKV